MDLSGKTALVVDDMQAIRKITSEQLRRFGFSQVLQAENGRQALKALTHQSVDIILADWNMPIMTGIELLEEVKKHAQLSHIPFILITAESERQRVQQAIQSGVSDLIIKPFNSQILQNRVQAAISGQVRNRAMAQSRPGAENTNSGNSSAGKRNTVLVVDDSPDNLALLSELLKPSYRVQLAKDGPRALGLCQSDTPPDLILLDVMMPVMDGFEVLKRLRSDPRSQMIPVIFVSALSEVKYQSRGLDGGAIDYITKPINAELLKLRVKNQLDYVNVRLNLQADYDNMLENQRLKEQVDQLLRHDLKGPLAAIAGLAEEIRLHSGDHPIVEEQANLIEELSMSSLDHINQSQELAKIERGDFELQPTPFSPAETVSKICDALSNTFRDKQLELQVLVEDQAITALGDPSLSYSMLFNAMKNAFEAAPEQTTLQVKQIVTPQLVKIEIINSGVVPQAIRHRFWDKYISQDKQGGTGLGTYSMKQLAEAQNGQVFMQTSDEHQLTMLSFELPRAIS
ncbi:hybrid sensor histidine kinase/response regulator [Aliagarivorans marinus]|uniref:hybrid sensor histidine kinase/response regulator n=1 Tax=Aliagarivorans marinus TaxID=561965 RepID=UPI0004245654|nr:hybrid sensor histidine kinase/response regulator [Aliagarivorans marinus]